MNIFKTLAMVGLVGVGVVYGGNSTNDPIELFKSSVLEAVTRKDTAALMSLTCTNGLSKSELLEILKSYQDSFSVISDDRKATIRTIDYHLIEKTGSQLALTGSGFSSSSNQTRATYAHNLPISYIAYIDFYVKNSSKRGFFEFMLGQENHKILISPVLKSTNSPTPQ